jgi:hypothetical protein
MVQPLIQVGNEIGVLQVWTHIRGVFTWFALIHQLQPNANIFSDAGPDVRWVGDETGEAGVTSWSMINRTAVTIGGAEEA